MDKTHNVCQGCFKDLGDTPDGRACKTCGEISDRTWYKEHPEQYHTPDLTKSNVGFEVGCSGAGCSNKTHKKEESRMNGSRNFVKKMSDLILLTEKHLVRTEGKITESLHLGGDPHQPTYDDASRTGLGRLAAEMSPPFDTDAGGHNGRESNGNDHQTELHGHTGVKSEGDEDSGKTVKELEKAEAIAEPKPDHGETAMGTQDPMGKDEPVHDQPRQVGSQDGMVIPPDRRGSYDDSFFASMTNEDLVAMFRKGILEDVKESLGGEATDRDMLFSLIQAGMTVEEAYEMVYEGDSLTPPANMSEEARNEIIEAIKRRIQRLNNVNRNKAFRVHTNEGKYTGRPEDHPFEREERDYRATHPKKIKTGTTPGSSAWFREKSVARIKAGDEAYSLGLLHGSKGQEKQLHHVVGIADKHGVRTDIDSDFMHVSDRYKEGHEHGHDYFRTKQNESNEGVGESKKKASVEVEEGKTSPIERAHGHIHAKYDHRASVCTDDTDQEGNDPEYHRFSHTVSVKHAGGVGTYQHKSKVHKKTGKWSLDESAEEAQCEHCGIKSSDEVADLHTDEKGKTYCRSVAACEKRAAEKNEACSTKEKREVKHIEKSEEGEGKSPKEAKKIAYATVNKQKNESVDEVTTNKNGGDWAKSTDICHNCGSKSGNKRRGKFCSKECEQTHQSELATEMSCPMCGSEEKKFAEPMGNRMHARCGSCGMDYSTKMYEGKEDITDYYAEGHKDS